MRARLLTLLPLAAATIAGAGQPDAASQIRTVRGQSNRAIAAHDFAALRGAFAEGYTILPGSSGAPFDISAFERRIAPTFADPTFVTYVRTPSRIDVADGGKRAAENGRWVGTWRSPAGATHLSGVYQATWVPTPSGWRIKNESFVSLRCMGPRCGEFF